jgi:valacyclovir hydrolase
MVDKTRASNEDVVCQERATEEAFVNGVQLHYMCQGDGPHPLLFIPGALGVVEHQFRPQLEYFGRIGSGFKVVAFDPRGYGRSCSIKRPKKDPFITDAKDAHELMVSLSLPEFSVLALCSGGRAGLVLASLFPQSVRNLVVFGTRSFVTDDEVKVYEEIWDVDSWKVRIREPLEKIYGDNLQEKWSSVLDELHGYLLKNNGSICTMALSSVSCPTLIIHGAKDAFTPLFQAEYLRDHVTGSQLVVMEDGKHMLHLKYHEQFNKIVENFLSPS